MVEREQIRIYDTVPLNTGRSKYELLEPCLENLGEAYESLFNPAKHREDLAGANTVIRLERIPSGHVSDKMDDEPYIVPFLTDASDLSVIVCPGGAYCDVSMENEGYPTAEFLRRMGINAFVLRYRIWPYRYPCAFLDLRRAVCYVKHHAEAFHIDPNKVSVIGFSAGGNLAATTALLFQKLPPIAGYTPDAVDEEDGSVATLGAVYPEVCADKALLSFQFGERILTDDAYRAAVQAEMYLPRRVTEASPPAFLCACCDDTVVNPINVLKLAEAYLERGVRCETHLFTEGGHGFGVTQENVPPMFGHNGFDMSGTKEWIRLYGSWLKKTVK